MSESMATPCTAKGLMPVFWALCNPYPNPNNNPNSKPNPMSTTPTPPPVPLRARRCLSPPRRATAKPHLHAFPPPGARARQEAIPLNTRHGPPPPPYLRVLQQPLQGRLHCLLVARPDQTLEVLLFHLLLPFLLLLHALLLLLPA